MKKKLLVVDDEPDLREVLCTELTSEGYEVFEAESGNKAFDFLQKTKCDLVLSDIRMPDGSGIDLIHKIKSQGQETPIVVFISGYSEMKPEDIYHLGAEGILAKPWKPEKLIDMVNTLLTTKENRWQRKSDRLDFQTSLHLKCSSFETGIHSKILNIGRGGMFVEMKERFPVKDERIAFSFENPNNTDTIEGVGIVRWVRTKDAVGAPSGIGIEFIELSDTHLMRLISLILQIAPKSFIPKTI